jgi:subfamily B ATP-binding cassette protein MsbA
MKNFGRVLRLCLRYRFSILASIVCAIAVGALWGGNIGGALPVIQVVFSGGSLQQWVDREIQEADQSAAECQALLGPLRRQLAEAEPEAQRRLRAEIASGESRLDAERDAAVRYRRLKPYVDKYLPTDPFRTLVLFVGVLLLGTLIKSLFLVAQQVLVARLAQLGVFELRNLFFRRSLVMDVTTFSREGVSDLMSRFTHDIQSVAMGLSAVFGKLTREPLKMIASLTLAAIICWRLLILSLVVAPLAGWTIRWLARTLKRANRRAMEEMALVYANLEEAFRGIRVVKAFTMERRERKRFHANIKRYYDNAMRIARYDALVHPLTEVMGMLIITLAMLAGAYLVLEGETHLLGIRMSERPLDLPALLIFYGSLIGAADPARKLSDIFAQLQGAAAASDRVFAMLDREASVRDPQCPRRLPRHRKELVFDQVTFAYEPGRPVLQDVNLRIEYGETVAIVGPSGCGKSTLANLIPRFADPTSGQVRLDSIPVDQLRLRTLRRQIGMVSQDPLLFNDTVLNNIRYGTPHASLDEVVQAAKQAYAHQFIERELSHGYHSVVGPMGGQLSGGQRQRICLARAILRDPAILILDEATSQIDMESEQIIQRVLERFIRGRTVVMITHRLASLALADRIVVMEDGRILDSGTHPQLLARCSLYGRLHQIGGDDLQRSA